MKKRITALILPIAALSLGGCEALAVANVIGNVLSPAPAQFAPSQNGPFRTRTAADDMSPVLDKVADAKVTDACKKNLQKLADAGEDTFMGKSDPASSAGEEKAAAVADTDNRTSGSGPAACTRKWVCLPAQNQPLQMSVCPDLAVVDRTVSAETPKPANEWAWDWNRRP